MSEGTDAEDAGTGTRSGAHKVSCCYYFPLPPGGGGSSQYQGSWLQYQHLIQTIVVERDPDFELRARGNYLFLFSMCGFHNYCKKGSWALLVAVEGGG